MSNDNVFLKAKEKETMEKFLNIASKMIRAEEIVASMTKSLVVSKKPDCNLREYLLQKAEIARLGRQINEAIRNHEIQCHDCGEVHKIREVRIRGNGDEAIILCPQGFFVRGTILHKDEVKSLERIMQFAQVNPAEIFNREVP